MAGIRAGIVIPWRSSDCVWRNGHRDLVEAHCRLTGLPTITASDTGSGPFNASAARNAGVRRLAEIDPEWEAVFLSDADTITPTDQIRGALMLARDMDGLVIGGDLLVKLDRRSTTMILPALQARIAGGQSIDALGRVSGTRHGDYALGGSAISRGLWEESGGYDERFVGWGGEDRSYNFVATVLRGRTHVTRVSGSQWHLYHPRSPDIDAHQSATRQANKALAVRYKRLAGFNGGMAGWVSERAAPATPPDLEGMKAILAEPGGPRHPETMPLGVVVECSVAS